MTVVATSPTTKTSPTLPLPLTVPLNGDLSSLVYVLDALLHGGPKSASTATPPTGPSQGDIYIVPTGATGAWAGQVGNIAVCTPQIVKDGKPNPYTYEWEFITPKPGMNMYIQDIGGFLTYTSAGVWVPDPVSFVSAAPANASAAGVKGQIWADTTQLCICIATNTWRKVATTTF
jgi:hypothetical protein